MSEEEKSQQQQLRFGKCPFEFSVVANNDAVKRHFVGYREVDGIARYEKDGYADKIYNFDMRDDDVWVISYPKSGTTWTQHMVWLILNPDDMDTKRRVDLRSPFLELDSLTPRRQFIREMEEIRERTKSEAEPDREFLEVLDFEISYLERTRLEDAEAIPKTERRMLKTHNPFCLLPPDLLKRNKVVYVARDPRDVLISYYHHHRLIKNHEFTGTFDQFFKYFVDEQVLWSPYWQHISQAWKHRDDPNLHFIFFDDMKKDLPGVLDRLSGFLDRPLTDADRAKVLEKLSIDAMKKNEATNDTDIMVRLGQFKQGEGSFVRKGKQGGWKGYFSENPEMLKTLEDWKDRNVKEFGHQLPPMDKLWPS